MTLPAPITHTVGFGVLAMLSVTYDGMVFLKDNESFCRVFRCVVE